MSQAPLDDTTTPHVIVRDGRQSDIALLCSSFANIYSSKRSHYGYCVPPQILVNKLEILINSPRWKLLVAAPSTADDEVMGMLLYRPITRATPWQTVAWVTVKPLWQRKGIAKALFAVAKLIRGDVECAFLIEDDVMRWSEQHGYTLLFRPYLPEVEMWTALEREVQK